MKISLNNIHYYTLQSIISVGLGLLVFAICARYLQAEILGVYLLSYSCSLVLNSVANMNLLAVYERNYFEFEASSRKSEQDILFYTLLIFSCFVIGIFSLVIYYLPTKIFTLLKLDKYSFLYVFIGMGIYFNCQFGLSRFKNIGDAYSFMKYGLIASVSLVIILIIFLILDIKYYPIEISFLFAQILAAFALLSKFPTIKRDKIFSPELLHYSLGISLPALPRVLVTSLNTQLDRIIAGGIGGPATLAIYGILQTVSSSIFLFMTALGRDFQPRVYKLLFDKNNSSFHNLLNPYIYLSGLTSLILAMFPDDLLSIIFGSQYRGNGYIVSFLVLIYFSMFIGKINGLQLLASKRTGVTSVIMTASMFINYISIQELYGLFSIFGLAISFALSQFFLTVCIYFCARIYNRINFQLNLYFFIIIILVFMIGLNSPILTSIFNVVAIKLIILSFYLFIGYRFNYFKLFYNKN